MIPTIIYASTSPLIFILTQKFKKSAVICFGYVIISIGLFLIGPSKMLGLYNAPAVIILGLLSLGFGCGMIIIPVMPDIIESIEERYPQIDDNMLSNIVSGLFIAF